MSTAQEKDNPFPIRKYDDLKRLIYVDYNGIERIINVYWNDTNKIKIKYRLWNKDTEMEAFDKNGKVIIKSSAGIFIADTPHINIKNGRLSFKVSQKKLKEWNNFDYSK